MDKRVSNEIRKLRQELGLTQLELADIIKTSGQNIANYELRRAMPPTSTYLKIMDLKPRFAAYIKMRKELLKLCD